MANVFVALAVPANDGVGAWSDVSAIGPEKTVSVDGGAFGGVIYLEASNDAQASAAPAAVGPFPGPTFKPQSFTQAYQFMRVRRQNAGSGAGTPTVTVAGPSASTANVFGAMNVPNGDGLGAAFDLSAGGEVNTFQVVGGFFGQILIETSTDGVNFSPTLLFDQGAAIGQIFEGVLSSARVRRRGSSVGGPTPAVSVGSGTRAGGGGGAFPGFGAAPPAVAAASAAGAAGTASRSDHTHAGTSSVNGATGAATFTSPGATINIGGAAPALTFDVANPFGGFGGVPPAIAAAGSAGAAGTASRSDHTHAGVSTFQGSTGAASITSTGGSVTVTHVAGVVNLEVAGGGAFPGFGGAPPAIAAASSAGAAGTASRSDHTHAGVTSVNGVQGAVALTAFPGFGGAPPTIATASAAGAAGTASRSDHTHGLDLVPYTPSVVGMQAAGTIQQSFAAGTATPSLLTSTPGLIPFGGGGAATGVLAESANLSYDGATGILASPQLTLNSSSGGGLNASLRFTQAATQAILKTNGVLTIGTGDANALAFATNNALVMTLDTGGNLFPDNNNTQNAGAAGNLWAQVFTSQLTGTNTTLTMNGAGGSSWHNTAGSCGILAPTIAIGAASAVGDTTLTPAGGGAGNAVTIAGTVAQFLKIQIPINLSAGNVTPNNLSATALIANGPTGISANPVEWALLSTPGGNRALPLFSMP